MVARATASGLSLRTIQRIEAEGNSSLESKVCLAATFDIALSLLDIVEVGLQKKCPLSPTNQIKWSLRSGRLAC